MDIDSKSLETYYFDRKKNKINFMLLFEYNSNNWLYLCGK